MNPPLAKSALYRKLSLLLCSLALTFAAPTFAQSPAGSAAGGTVSGTVLAPESGKFLIGADISIVGTALHTTSSRGGAFVIENVPAGAQQLAISYPGQESKTIPVTISAGQTINVPVTLGSEIVKLSTFTVESAKEGMAAAVAQQKQSINEKIVEASDQYGDISEGNAAEYLKFLPGVNIEYNANDARAIGLRGMPTYFTNIMLNGNPLASASSANTNRRFEFEQVSLNNVATIEVNKTLTPDQQATSTAGSVNFVSKSAFDREGSLLTYRAYVTAADTDLYLNKQPGYSSSKVNKIWPGMVVDYSLPINDKYGFDVNVSESNVYNDYPKVTYAYQFNPAFGGTPQNPYPLTWDITNEQKLTKREQLEGTFDYRPNPNFKAQVTAGWAWYWLVFEDRDYTFTIGNLAALAAGATTPTYAGAASVSSAANNGKIGEEVSERWKTGTTYFVNTPMEQKLGDNFTVSGTPYWTQSYSKYRDSSLGNVAEVDGAISKINTTLSLSGALNPTRSATYDVAGTSPVDPNNLGGYTLTQIRLRPQTGFDTWHGGPINFKYDLATQIPMSFMFGYRYDDHVRQDQNFLSTLTTFTAPNNTGPAVANLVDNAFGKHAIGYGIAPLNWLSPYKAYSLYPPTSIPPVALSSDTYAIWNEYTSAPYARFDTTLWDRLLIVAGDRYERHKIDSFNRLNGAQARTLDSRQYPSINMKYNFTKNFDLRVGAYKSLGLPDYNNLLPSAPTVTDPTASSPSGTISVFNPGITPYTIYNYDASLEYYFNHGSSFISASVYDKRFQNYLVTFTQGGSAALAAQYGVNTSSLNFPISQYNITSTINIPDASGYYNGLELAYNQTLTFLPAPFNTSGIQINWSRLSISGIHTHEVLSSTSANQNAALQRQAFLALYNTAITNEFNFAFNTTYKRLNAFITLNYTGEGLLSNTSNTVTYTGAPADFYISQTKTAPRALTDVRLEYQLSSRVTPYIQVHNLFNRPIINTVDERTVLHAQYGDPSYEIGIRGVW